MNNKTKLSSKLFLCLFLFIGCFYSANPALADNQEPILIEIRDTDIGTNAFEQLVSYGNGGHSAIGDILGNAQNMSTNPGIGFSIGSGGNGYRPSIIIAVWTDKPFDSSVGLSTIKSYFNVSSSPVVTNGDCAVACDGTTQTSVVETVTTEPSTTTTVVPTVTTELPTTVTTVPTVVATVPTVVVQVPIVATVSTTTTVASTNYPIISASSSILPDIIIYQVAKPITKEIKITSKIIKSQKTKSSLSKIKKPIK